LGTNIYRNFYRNFSLWKINSSPPARVRVFSRIHTARAWAPKSPCVACLINSKRRCIPGLLAPLAKCAAPVLVSQHRAARPRRAHAPRRRLHSPSLQARVSRDVACRMQPWPRTSRSRHSRRCVPSACTSAPRVVRTSPRLIRVMYDVGRRSLAFMAPKRLSPETTSALENARAPRPERSGGLERLPASCALPTRRVVLLLAGSHSRPPPAPRRSDRRRQSARCVWQRQMRWNLGCSA
jgi:hypothetical protein